MAMNLSYLKVICPFCNVKLQIEDNINCVLSCKTCKNYAYHKDARMIYIVDPELGNIFVYLNSNIIDIRMMSKSFILKNEKEVMKYVNLILEDKIKKVLMLQ